MGLGKSATVLAFLQSLRADFGCPGPILVVAPADSLPFWEGAAAMGLLAGWLEGLWPGSCSMLLAWGLAFHSVS